MNRIFFLLLISLLALPVSAATIRVERDGSADYTVIQDAVDAAASGDTIYIGPGRYNEGEIVTTAGWSEFVRVLVHQDELTLIGAGPDDTILGPTTPYDYSQGSPRGIEAGPWFGCNSLHVEGIGFENMWGGIVGGEAPEVVFVKNCRFESNRTGVSCLVGGGALEVVDCIFDGVAEGGRQLLCTDAEQVTVRNCNFEIEAGAGLGSTAVHSERIIFSDIQNCNFSGGSLGLVLNGGDPRAAYVSGCNFVGQELKGVHVGGCDLVIDNCFFEQQKTAIFLMYTSTELRATNCAIMDVSDLSLSIASVGLVEVTDCILAHGPEYTVKQYWFCDKGIKEDLTQLTMTNNDWGTTDAETIASWIYMCDYEVQYIPFIGQPVATESIEFGGLKALFR